jgi:predicted ester cyclase
VDIAVVTDDAGTLVRRLHAEVLAARDLGVVDEFFAPDFVSHTNPPGLPDDIEGVRRFFAMFRDAMPDVEVTIDELIVDGDRAAVATTITGTHTGGLLGLPASGQRVDVVGVAGGHSRRPRGHERSSPSGARISTVCRLVARRMPARRLGPRAASPPQGGRWLALPQRHDRDAR